VKAIERFVRKISALMLQNNCDWRVDYMLQHGAYAPNPLDECYPAVTKVTRIIARRDCGSDLSEDRVERAVVYPSGRDAFVYFGIGQAAGLRCAGVVVIQKGALACLSVDEKSPLHSSFDY
jgi:hypothetical protein